MRARKSTFCDELLAHKLHYSVCIPGPVKTEELCYACASCSLEMRMKVAVPSYSHDNIWNQEKALKKKSDFGPWRDHGAFRKGDFCVV